MCNHTIIKTVKVESDAGPYAGYQCQLCGLVLQENVTAEELAQLDSLPLADHPAYRMAVGESIDRWRRNRDKESKQAATAAALLKRFSK